jgi:O-antigen/teichoic acid export membrane protein
MNSRKIKAKKGLITSLFQYGILVVLQFILIPLILKISGQEILGANILITQLLGYCILLDLGISTSVTRYLSHNFDEAVRKDNFKQIFNIGRFLILITNLFASIFLVIISLNLNELFVITEELISDVKIGIWIMAIWILIRSPLLIYSHALNATQNMKIVNVANIISTIIRFALSIIAIYSGLDLLGLILSVVLSELVNLSFQRTQFKKLYQCIELNWSIPEVKLTREILEFGIKYWVINLAILLSIGSDTIIVSHFYGAAAVSVYYTTKTPAFLIMQLIYKISDNASSAANELISQKKYEVLTDAYLKIMKYTLFIGMPVSIGLIGFNEAFISAWIGKNQYAGTLMTLSISVFFVTQIINHVNAMIVVGFGDLNEWTRISMICSIITIVLAYVCSKYLGMQWIMFVIALMDIPIFVFLLRKSLVHLNIKLYKFYEDVLRPALLVSSPLIILICYSLFEIIEYNYLNLFLAFLLYVITWMISIYIFGVNNKDKNKINFIIASLFARKS